MADTRAIAEFMDAEVCCRLAAGEDLGTVAGVSTVLLEALDDVAMRGRTVLDVGCGAGAFGIELLRRGAADLTGVDLSPQAVTAARESSARRGLADRARFTVADGAQAELAPADVVVLNKVYCCYFDPTRLLANTLPATGSTYAVVVPASRGLRGAVSRAVIGAENLWRAVRRNPFRAYVHDVARLDTAVREAGFAPTVLRRHWHWEVRVYERASPAPGQRQRAGAQVDTAVGGDR